MPNVLERPGLLPSFADYDNDEGGGFPFAFGSEPPGSLIDASFITVAPANRANRVETLNPEHFTDADYEAMFGPGMTFVPDGIFVPDEALSDTKLLPPLEYLGATTFGEVAETFLLNGDPEFATKRLCTFEDLKITTRDRKLTKFVPKQVQSEYLDTILPGWKEAFASKSPLRMRGLREFILKPRQLGFSTLILALFFLDTISTPNTQTVIIAHDAETTKKLFDKMRLFYENLPEEKRPRTGYYSRHEIWFPELNSYIHVGTAGSGQYGRGGTVQNVHGSEVAFWPNPEEINAGLLESVPLDGNIFIESTANGYGGWYDENYFKSKAGETDYTARFFPWKIEPEYQRDTPDGFAPTAAEVKLANLHHLTPKQIYWRRQKKATLGPLFEQEFPITDIEAFVTSGDPYFDRVELNALYDAMRTLRVDEDDKTSPLIFAPFAGNDPALKEAGLTAYNFPELFRELFKLGINKLPQLSIWQPPVPGAMYCIGADVAEGDERTDGKDFDAACVLRADNLEEVAQLRGQWGNSKADYAVLLSQLGYFYNTALLAVERNNHGLSVLNTLQNGRHGFEQWVYPIRVPGGGGLYYAESIDERQSLSQRIRRARKQSSDLVKKPGWFTSGTSKSLIMDYLDEVIKRRRIGLNSIVTVQELMTYVKKGIGKSGGEGKSHDDTVIALGIAAYLAQTIDLFALGGATDLLETMGEGSTQAGGNRAGGGITSLFGGV